MKTLAVLFAAALVLGAALRGCDVELDQSAVATGACIGALAARR